MRVIHTSRESGPEESGAVLPFVAILAVVLFGIGAIAVDLGNGWATRRSLITATDAGARAAAQEFANGGDGCASIGRDYVLENVDDAVNIVCEPNLAAQYVTVDAEANVETWFAGVLGLGDFDAGSSSTVRWGGARSAGGLRPLMLCAASPDIQPWLSSLSSPMGYQGPPIEVFFEKDLGQPEECNDDDAVNGNWGVLDFDGNGPGQTVGQMVDDGYEGIVQKGNPDLEACPDPGYPLSCVQGQTGQVTSIKQKLQGLIGEPIVLPLVNYVDDGEPGQVSYHVVGFAGLRITALNLTGQPNQRSITIQFEELLVQGECCDTTSGPSNVNVIQACAVDRRELGACSG